MARVFVSIEIPDLVEQELRDNPDWFISDEVHNMSIVGKEIVIDEAYLTRYIDDDSFFVFKFLYLEEADDT